MTIKEQIEKITTELGGVVRENERLRAGISQARAAKAEAMASRDQALSAVYLEAATTRLISANQSLSKLEPELVAGEMREAELRPKLQFLSGEREHERLAEVTKEYQEVLADGIGKINQAVAAALKCAEIRERARLMFPHDVSPNGRRIPPGSGLPYFDASLIARLWYEQKLEIARYYPEALPVGDPARVQAEHIKAAIADGERMSDAEQARQRAACRTIGHVSGRLDSAVDAYNERHVAKPN